MGDCSRKCTRREFLADGARLCVLVGVSALLPGCVERASPPGKMPGGAIAEATAEVTASSAFWPLSIPAMKPATVESPEPTVLTTCTLKQGAHNSLLAQAAGSGGAARPIWAILS